MIILNAASDYVQSDKFYIQNRYDDVNIIIKDFSGNQTPSIQSAYQSTCLFSEEKFNLISEYLDWEKDHILKVYAGFYEDIKKIYIVVDEEEVTPEILDRLKRTFLECAFILGKKNDYLQFER